MNSMTGFGYSEVEVDGMQVSVTVRSVNSRFLDCHVHLPREWLELESSIKEMVRERVRRGRVEVFADRKGFIPGEMEVVEPLVVGYLQAAEQMRALGATGRLSVGELLSLPGVTVQQPAALEEIRSPLLDALRSALDSLVAARRSEGAALQRVISDHLERLEDLVKKMALEADRVPSFHEQRLRERLAAWGDQVDIEPARLAQEVLLYIERSDITEELNRLFTHGRRFRELIASSDERAVGKDLDFLCQELNREVNTILSKAGLTEVSELGVQAKAEIERLREQVQNVE